MLLFLVVGCGNDPDPASGLPAGGFISTTGVALGEVAECLVAFEGSKAAEVGAAWKGLAAACPGEVYGEGAEAWTSLGCAAPPAAVLAFRGDASVAFGRPRDDLGVVRGQVRSEGGGLRADVWVPLPAELGATGLAVPGESAAGPAVLSDADAVLHARMRPRDGIDVGSLVESGTQADTLFGLKGALLSRAVLTGDWEFAAYPPLPGGEVPQLALAVGVRPDAGKLAVEAFADGLRQRWSVQRQATSVAGHAGECLGGLRIMPQFEPCYVLTPTHLVAGWNLAAVESALAGVGDWPGIAAGAGGVASVDLDAMSRADGIFAANRPPESTLPPLRYPLRRLVIAARPEGRELRIEAQSTGRCGP